MQDFVHSACFITHPLWMTRTVLYQCSPCISTLFQLLILVLAYTSSILYSILFLCCNRFVTWLFQHLRFLYQAILCACSKLHAPHTLSHAHNRLSKPACFWKNVCLLLLPCSSNQGSWVCPSFAILSQVSIVSSLCLVRWQYCFQRIWSSPTKCRLCDSQVVSLELNHRRCTMIECREQTQVGERSDHGLTHCCNQQQHLLGHDTSCSYTRRLLTVWFHPPWKLQKLNVLLPDMNYQAIMHCIYFTCPIYVFSQHRYYGT